MRRKEEEKNPLLLLGLARGYFLKYTISVFCCWRKVSQVWVLTPGPHTHTHTVGPEATGGLILSPRRPPSSSAAPQLSILKTSCWLDLCADVSAGPARVRVCSLPDSRFFLCQVYITAHTLTCAPIVSSFNL